jgi:hypothetical protein
MTNYGGHLFADYYVSNKEINITLDEEKELNIMPMLLVGDDIYIYNIEIICNSDDDVECVINDIPTTLKGKGETYSFDNVLIRTFVVKSNAELTLTYYL